MSPRADFADDPCGSTVAAHPLPISAAREGDAACTDFGLQPDFRPPTRKTAVSVSGENLVFVVRKPGVEDSDSDFRS
jgi:hypothetical protein